MIDNYFVISTSIDKAISDAYNVPGAPAFVDNEKILEAKMKTFFLDDNHYQMPVINTIFPPPNPIHVGLDQDCQPKMTNTSI